MTELEQLEEVLNNYFDEHKEELTQKILDTSFRYHPTSLYTCEEMLKILQTTRKMEREAFANRLKKLLESGTYTVNFMDVESPRII